jgi:hypothetical protein
LRKNGDEFFQASAKAALLRSKVSNNSAQKVPFISARYSLLDFHGFLLSSFFPKSNFWRV